MANESLWRRHRNEWRRFALFVGFYGVLSLLVLLRIVDPVFEWLIRIAPFAAPLGLLAGPPVTLSYGLAHLRLFVIETVVVLGLVLWCVFLWRQSEPASMGVAMFTFLVWIGCAFVAGVIGF